MQNADHFPGFSFRQDLLTMHLGNVLSTVSDQKIAVEDGNSGMAKRSGLCGLRVPVSAKSAKKEKEKEISRRGECAKG